MNVWLAVAILNTGTQADFISLNYKRSYFENSDINVPLVVSKNRLEHRFSGILKDFLVDMGKSV